MEPLVDALQLVLDDVRAWDLITADSTASPAAGEKPPKLFLSGASLGGFIWYTRRVCVRSPLFMR